MQSFCNYNQLLKVAFGAITHLAMRHYKQKQQNMKDFEIKVKGKIWSLISYGISQLTLNEKSSKVKQEKIHSFQVKTYYRVHNIYIL